MKHWIGKGLNRLWAQWHLGQPTDHGAMLSTADKNGTSKRTFSVPEHSSSLLRSLASLRAQAKLLDITLTTDNEAFQAHKVVLAACSDVFQAMFTEDMREATQGVIELKGMSVTGLQCIIEFAYSAEVTLDLGCIQDVLKAAVFLQMAPVVEICKEFLKSTTSVQTWLSIGQIATTFSLTSLKYSADTFAFQHFLQVSKEADFLQLPLERLVVFLQSNKLNCCREIDIFRAAIRWLQHDPSRRSEASRVLCHIRFPLMKASELVDDVQSVDIMVEDDSCHQFLVEALNYQALPFQQHEMQSARTAVRSDVLSLIAFGGNQYLKGKCKINRKVYCLPNVHTQQFKFLTEMEVGSTDIRVAVLDNFVYIVGGQDEDVHGGFCCRYDPHWKQWLRIQALRENRIRFQLNALHGVLYATGGLNTSGTLASVEKYYPKSNKWSYVCPLKHQLWGHAGATIGSKLYISGGQVTLVDASKALHCYDPTADQWVFRAGMNEPRIQHAMVSTSIRIYVFGGTVRDGHNWVNVMSVEYYVPENDQWTTVSSMRMGQSMAGCCLLQEKIFLVGGYNRHLQKDMSIVQVYNTETDQWDPDLNFPESLSQIACAPVILPQNKTQRKKGRQEGSNEGSPAEKTCPSKCTFSVPEHSRSLLRSLAFLRAQEKLPDVTLTTDNETFQVHKVVLAACSDFFRAMFTSDMREATQDVIELKGASAKGLERIIEFAYSAEVTLDLDCIQDVLEASVFLQMVPVVQICQEFLQSTLSVQTWLDIRQIATTFSLASLKESADAFAFQHFMQVSGEADFLQLPLERLVFFLQSNKFKSCREIDLFWAAIHWLRHDPSRRSEASRVLCHIRFPLMKLSELLKDVPSVDIMVEDVLCQGYLMEALQYQFWPFRQHEMQSARTTIRSDVLSLIAFGGVQRKKQRWRVNRKVYSLPNVHARQFELLTEMAVGSTETRVAVMDNFVYIVGKQEEELRGCERAADFCCCYDPRLNQWLHIQALQQNRVRFQLNALHGELYATGGWNDSGPLASVEKYCPKSNEWSYVCPLKHQLWSHAAATMGGKLYLSGGEGTSVDASKALHCYDPTADQWVFRTAMNEPRSLHAMASTGSRIYVFGGILCDGDDWSDVLSVEYYVPENDQWTTVSSMRMGQSKAGCCLLQEKIFLVGGYNRHLRKVLSIVQVYNTGTDQWEQDLSFPETFSRIACAPVILPQEKTQR